MTEDRELLLIAYGALKGLNEAPSVCETIERALWPGFDFRTGEQKEAAELQVEASIDELSEEARDELSKLLQEADGGHA